MKKIPLTQGKFALVDDRDFERVGHFKWCAMKHHRKHFPDTYYARRRDGKKLVSMHRAIFGLTDPRIQVDHVNRNGLDNRRCNLRIASQSENLANQRSARGTSKYKGVYLQRQIGKWVAQIYKHKRMHYLGAFICEENAAQAYDDMAFQLYGHFAKLNLPHQG